MCTENQGDNWFGTEEGGRKKEDDDDQDAPAYKKRLNNCHDHTSINI